MTDEHKNTNHPGLTDAEWKRLLEIDQLDIDGLRVSRAERLEANELMAKLNKGIKADQVTIILSRLEFFAVMRALDTSRSETAQLLKSNVGLTEETRSQAKEELRMVRSLWKRLNDLHIR